MNKYLVFVWSFFKTRSMTGGWNDYVGSTDSLTEAHRLAEQEGDAYQIVDREENKIVEDGTIIQTTRFNPHYHLSYSLVPGGIK